MVKAEIRPRSSSAPELLASAIKHQAAEGAVEQGLPITELAPCRARRCPGPQLPHALVSLAGDVIFPIWQSWAEFQDLPGSLKVARIYCFSTHVLFPKYIPTVFLNFWQMIKPPESSLEPLVGHPLAHFPEAESFPFGLISLLPANSHSCFCTNVAQTLPLLLHYRMDEKVNGAEGIAKHHCSSASLQQLFQGFFSPGNTDSCGEIFKALI